MQATKILLPLSTKLNFAQPSRKLSKDLASMVMLMNEMSLRPYVVPRRVYHLKPLYRSRLDDDFFTHFDNVFGETNQFLRPGSMLKDLDEIARFVAGIEDAPLRIKHRDRKALSESSPETGASGEDASKSEKYAVQVKAQDFKPEEIIVKVKDGYVTVEAQKEENDSGNGIYKYQEIRMSFLLPSNVDPDSVVCEMTKDGFLNIKADWTQTPQLEESRRIPIQNTAENATSETTEMKGSENKAET